MIVYNMNFLIAALVILVIVLWQIFNQRRMEDANNRVFRLIVFLGFGDISIMTDFMFCADFCTKKTHSFSQSKGWKLSAIDFVKYCLPP